MRFSRLSLSCKGVLGNGRLVVSLFRRCKTFCKECKLNSTWHYTEDYMEVQVKWSEILIDRFCQDNFWTLQSTHLIKPNYLVAKQFWIPITYWSQIGALYFWSPIYELLLIASPTLSWAMSWSLIVKPVLPVKRRFHPGKSWKLENLAWFKDKTSSAHRHTALCMLRQYIIYDDRNISYY